MDAQKKQARHYDEVLTDYDAHYGDACSLRYRERFIHRPLFHGIDLSGMAVLDGMCGGGETTGGLLQRGAHVTGLDLSERQLAAYRRKWPQCRTVCASILESRLETSSLDCVVVVGGLHHVHPHVHAAIEEIHRILRPGGYFCFFEPHARSWPDVVRKQWYKRDRFFERNEQSVDVDELKRAFGGRFDFLREHYGGSIAYLLVLNSMIFRIPVRLKPLYTPPLMVVEGLLQGLHGKRLSMFAVCQWRKTPKS